MRSLVPLAAAHVVGNALLLWLGYYWLGLGESRASTLAWSALVALFLVTLECFLHGSTFAWFSLPKRWLPLRRLPPGWFPPGWARRGHCHLAGHDP